MKVVLAGAFGHLGEDILRSLVKAGHDVVAADLVTRELKDCTGYKAVKVDMTKPDQVKGLCDGAEAVITTVGLTTTNAKITNYDIDWGANKNLVDEAVRAGVKNFAYVSVLKAEYAPEERKRLSTLIRRIEYDIDAKENVTAFWRLADEAGFSAEYLARFAAEIIVHQKAFLQNLAAFSSEGRRAFVDVVAEALNGER